MINLATGGVLEVRLSGAGAACGPVCDDRFDQNGNQVGFGRVAALYDRSSTLHQIH